LPRRRAHHAARVLSAVLLPLQVTKLIQEDIKQWHGFQLVTKAPQ
jgi:hypothetical protein